MCKRLFLCTLTGQLSAGSYPHMHSLGALAASKSCTGTLCTLGTPVLNAKHPPGSSVHLSIFLLASLLSTYLSVSVCQSVYPRSVHLSVHSRLICICLPGFLDVIQQFITWSVCFSTFITLSMLFNSSSPLPERRLLCQLSEVRLFESMNACKMLYYTDFMEFLFPAITFLMPALLNFMLE